MLGSARGKRGVALRGAVVSVVLMGILPGMGSAGATSSAISWLAAGDSFASGQGLPHLSGSCARAAAPSQSWAAVAAAGLRRQGLDVATPKLVACTGADTTEFFNPQTGEPPQWTASMGQFDLVTFSFGGDDVGFAPIITACMLQGDVDTDPGEKCTDHYVRPRIAQLAKAYPNFLEEVARKAVVAGGNVVVMGYPELVEIPTLWDVHVIDRCQYGIDPQHARYIRGWAGDINASIGYAVTEANAAASKIRNGVHFTFIDPVSGNHNIAKDTANLFEPSSGTRHELCSQGDQNWLNGVSSRAGVAKPGWIRVAASLATGGNPASFVTIQPQPTSFHPTQAGTNAMGDLAAKVIGTLTWPAGGAEGMPQLVVPRRPGSPIFAGIRPAVIGFSGDATNIVHGLRWTSWSSSGAVGHGTWLYDSCTPDCADARLMPYLSTITLADAVNGVFTKMTETTTGNQPLARTYDYPTNWATDATATTSFATPGTPGCTATTLQAGIDTSETPLTVNPGQFQCTDGFAYAFAVGGTTGTLYTATVLFKAAGSAWQVVPRPTYCEGGQVPQFIYTNACNDD